MSVGDIIFVVFMIISGLAGFVWAIYLTIDIRRMDKALSSFHEYIRAVTIYELENGNQKAEKALNILDMEYKKL